ncbi:type VI secretion system protein ImpA [Chitinivorax tropicus]|uniref:Type VI secretion system protein ImpA n=1 Tax=Chitinivorax tropicus TaxID=714531 RepID=A0A840MXN9_9PROT|nr:type VI secretion system protein TssA [Chitinivorax tropicus]MBB5019921.1 type VI secretion system protein ImpA [Chitinivorax tropicus]
MDKLLSPISDSAPCGEDMSFSAEFDQIKEARRDDDPSLAQGEWVADVKRADWDQVCRICEDVLTQHTKDLRVASWYVEALAKTQGFAGLAKGCDVLRELQDRYWDQLHPQPEDGDLELRIGTLTYFVSQLVDLIRTMPLCQAPQGRFSLADHESAMAFQAQLDKDPDLRDAIPAGKYTLEQVQEAQRATPTAFYQKLIDGFREAKQSWQLLANSIDQHLGIDGPSFGALEDMFDKVGNLLTRITRNAGVGLPTTPAAEQTTLATASGAPDMSAMQPAYHAMPPQGSWQQGQIMSREQAIKMLEAVAEYFRRTEPHSPVTYLAQKAADWGNMPLHEWLQEVVKDGSTLSQVQELLGIRS